MSNQLFTVVDGRVNLWTHVEEHTNMSTWALIIDQPSMDTRVNSITIPFFYWRPLSQAPDVSGRLIIPLKGRKWDVEKIHSACSRVEAVIRRQMTWQHFMLALLSGARRSYRVAKQLKSCERKCNFAVDQNAGSGEIDWNSGIIQFLSVEKSSLAGSLERKRCVIYLGD